MWEVLEIEPTTDKRAIKRAYARLTAKYHPEEYPDEFKRIHEAYQQALKYAEYQENIYPEGQEKLQLRIHLQDSGRGRDEHYLKDSEGNRVRQTVQEERDSNVDYEKLVLKKDSHEERFFSSTPEEKIAFKEILGREQQREPVRKQEEKINFENLQEKNDKERISLKQEQEVDFGFLEHMEEEKWPDIDRRMLDENSKEITQPKKKIFSVIWIILMIVLTVGSRLIKLYVKERSMENSAGNAVTEMLDAIEGKISGNQYSLENYLEEHYKAEFEVASIDVPEDILEIYYLIQPEKTAADYQWFLVHSKDGELEADFYASWDKEEGFSYDYGYRQMFAAISYVGLSNYLDDKDNYNMEYYKKGEQRYCYPVLFIEGEQDDVFYDRLEMCVNRIAEMDAVFEDHDHVTINFINPGSQIKYNLQIRKGETCDRESMQKALNEIACSSYQWNAE